MAYEDLIKDTSQSFENGNYFILTITDLDVNQPYPVQFRWKNKDGSFSKWGAAKTLSTPGESDPATPRLQSANVVGGAGFLSVTWDGKNSTGVDLTNIDRVDVYIDGPPFDGTKPTDNFKSSGTKTFVAPAGSYTVTLVAVSKLGTLSPTSTAITKSVTSVATPIATPEDPSAPTITAGLASIIVSWDGKNSDDENFAAGAFAGAKVYIGTTSTFTPSADNWVHSLNFANGNNQVSIGVGTVINKTSGATLQYGTPYFIKLRTINASGTETSTAIASSPTSITVDKLPASEIKTGILAADASITAGASSGARVVMSGASSPFIIYGTDGSTKLLEFIGGSTGTLVITGSSTFSGNLSVGSGNSIFKAEPATGMWLGNATESSAPFSVSNNGVIRATSGTIGGWYLGSSTLQNASSSPTIRLNTSGIIVGATSSSYIDIAADGITHRNSNGTASGKFTLTTGASPSLTVNGSITASTFSLSGSGGDSWSSGGAFQFGGASGIKYSGSGNLTIGASGNTVTVNTSTGAVTVANITASQFSIDTNNYWNSTGFLVGNGTNKLEYVSSTGVLTVTGQISRDLNNYWNSTGFRAGNASAYIEYSSSGSGTLTVTGRIQASSGYIGGWTISSDGYISSADTFFYPNTTPGGNSSTYSFITTRGIGAYSAVIGYASATASTDVFTVKGASALNGNLAVIGGSIINGSQGMSSLGSISAGVGGFTTAATLFVGSGATFNSTIYANTLGTGSGLAIHQVQTGGNAGYLKVNTSTIRHKENIVPINKTNYINIIDQLTPVTFNYKEEIDPDKLLNVGLVAEDLEQIAGLENLVVYGEDGLPIGISYDKLPVFLILALKEMKDRLDALEG
jgi:hypothetical protein